MENYDDSALPENEKNKFQKEYHKPKPPVDLESRIINELRIRKAFGLPLFQRKASLRFAFMMVLVAATFFAGYRVGIRKTSSLSFTSNSSPYLLLLSNPSNFRQGVSHAKEYGHWFRNMRDSNAQGEALNEKGWTIRLENNSPFINQSTEQENQVSGYFIINASSDKEALSIAASCPHIRYNGIITIRPIQLNP